MAANPGFYRNRAVDYDAQVFRWFIEPNVMHLLLFGLVILSVAKNLLFTMVTINIVLNAAIKQILRCTQNDNGNRGRG